MITGHGGNIHALARQIGCRPHEILDLSSNINPFGPMPELLAHLRNSLPAIATLPEVDAKTLVLSTADRFGVDPEGVVAGNGTTCFIHALPEILAIRKALILGPTYSDYADACTREGARVHHLVSRAQEKFALNLSRLKTLVPGFDTVFICNPNNPTGRLFPKKDLQVLMEAFPRIRFVVDESYLPFVEEGEKQSLIPFDAPNRIVLYSLSKIFAVPGLRAGLMFFPPSMKKAVLNRHVPWSVNTLAQEAALFLMENRELSQQFIETSRRALTKEKDRFLQSFKKIKAIRFFSGRTPFILGRLQKPGGARRLCTYLQQHRILIRNCRNFRGLSDQYVRISLKTPPWNRKCAHHMLDYLGKEAIS